MKTYKSIAIVFRTVKYSETSIIVDLYTRERGMRAFIVNGVRSSRGKMKAGLFQLMTVLDLVAYDRDDGKLARLREVALSRHYEAIPFDVIRSSLGIFMLEVSRNCIREDEPNPALYDFIQGAFIHLDTTADSLANIHLAFMLELSTYLGFSPDMDRCEGDYFDLMEGRFVKQPVSSYYLEPLIAAVLMELLDSTRQSAHLVKMDRSTRQQVLCGVIDYYRLHMHQFKPLKSLEVLRQIL